MATQVENKNEHWKEYYSNIHKNEASAQKQTKTKQKSVVGRNIRLETR
jgi:hypothetical protein